MAGLLHPSFEQVQRLQQYGRGDSGAKPSDKMVGCMAVLVSKMIDDDGTGSQ